MISYSEPRPTARVRTVGDAAPRPEGDYVLYWMIATRRADANFALERARAWSRHLGKPVLVVEALRCDYHWASDRLHHFVLDGMRDNAAAFARLRIAYYPYVEPRQRDGAGLLEALAASAAVVVTDRSPAFDLNALVDRASRHVSVRFESIDSNGIIPLDTPPPGLVFSSAYQFRRYLHKTLPLYLDEPVSTDDMRPMPHGERLAAAPAAVQRRWPAATRGLLEPHRDLSAFPIDHAIGRTEANGGASAAAERLSTFLNRSLARYDERAHPDEELGSGLSPYLHFGHIAPQTVLRAVLEHEQWTPDRLARTVAGNKQGWWGLSPQAEAFLDELITWRELGFNMAARRPDHDRFESLPPWAIATLEAHASDSREHVYSQDAFAAAATHDPLWNAAQRQLASEGRMHNYLRMLWGKKILEWTATPRDALAVMIELNNRFALDGRDPNSYSGIGWVLGRYDRPWAPERQVFGVVRYMSSANTARKLHVNAYMRRFGPVLF